MRDLDPKEREQYSRQMALAGIGEAGQRRLAETSVLVVGLGGLGSAAATYLVGAGVGRVGLIDGDRVEAHNLHRQVMHGAGRMGRLKTESAAERLADLNPRVRIETHPGRAESATVQGLIDRYDMAVDASDNFATRYLMNDACVLGRKPLLHAGAIEYGGQALTVVPRRGPCLRCLFPEPPRPGETPTSAQVGIFGPVAGILGLVQATEALKLALGVGRPLVGRLLSLSALDMSFRILEVERSPECAVCGDRPTITAPGA
jgi:adenylyltransferase/sulfurtransferase